MISFSVAAQVDPNYIPRHLDVGNGTGVLSLCHCRPSIYIYIYGDKIDQIIDNPNFKMAGNKHIVARGSSRERLEMGRERAVSQLGRENLKIVNFLHCIFESN